MLFMEISKPNSVVMVVAFAALIGVVVETALNKLLRWIHVEE